MGNPSNDALTSALCAKAHDMYGMNVRVGGGIRGVSRASKIVAWGADQIIIGSAAFHEGRVNARFLRRLQGKINARRIVVALDTAKSHIVTHGWRRRLKLRAEDVMAKLEPFCSAFLCTDVDREGTMSGANLEWFRHLRSATSHPVIAAGGIKTHREISLLEKIGMDAAVGMAVYKNHLR